MSENSQSVNDLKETLNLFMAKDLVNIVYDYMNFPVYIVWSPDNYNRYIHGIYRDKSLALKEYNDCNDRDDCDDCDDRDELVKKNIRRQIGLIDEGVLGNFNLVGGRNGYFCCEIEIHTYVTKLYFMLIL